MISSTDLPICFRNFSVDLGCNPQMSHHYIAARLPTKRMIPYWSSHQFVCLTFCLPFRTRDDDDEESNVDFDNDKILRTRYLEFHKTRSSSLDFQTSHFFWPHSSPRSLGHRHQVTASCLERSVENCQWHLVSLGLGLTSQTDTVSFS